MILLSFINLTILFFVFTFTYGQECVKQDLCSKKTLKSKFDYFSSPLASGCKNKEDANMINNFLNCASLFSNCGALPESYNKEDPFDYGVQIGVGLDLGNVDSALLLNANVDQEIVDAVTPYLGKKGVVASIELSKKNLTLTVESAEKLSKSILTFHSKKLAVEYNEVACETCIREFSHLNPNIQAALISFAYNFNGIKTHYPEIWASVINNNWEKLADLIEEVKYPPMRRRAETLAIRSISNTCKNRKTDTLFLYGNTNMYHNKQWEGFRQFFLNYINMTNISYNRINFATGTDQIFTPLLDHFTDSREEIYELVHNDTTFPMVQQPYDLHTSIPNGVQLFKYSKNDKTIVITSFRGDGGIFDGDKWLNIRQQADWARNSGVRVIAIAQDFDKTTLDKLYDIVGGDENNIISNEGGFDEEAFACSNVTLYSKICSFFNDQRVIVSGNHSIPEEHIAGYNYPNFYKLDRVGSNLNTIRVVPTGKNIITPSIQMFVSYTNTYPDVLLNDFSHLGNNEGPKSITIAPSSNTTAYSIYVGVYGDDFSYTIEFSECVPNGSTCVAGSNDEKPKTPLSPWLIVLIVFLSLIAVLGLVYGVYKYKKSKVVDNSEFSKIKDPIMP